METNTIPSSPMGASSFIPPATGSSRLNVGTTERIASVIGGTALAVYAMRNWNTTTGKLLGIAGTLLLKRGATGYCEINNAIGRNSALKKASAIEASASYIINRPREEVYAYWRNFENLPSFMKHLESVEVEDDKRSVWTAKLPGGVGTVTWEAIMQDEDTNNRISWNSLPGSTIDNAGEVRFSDAPGGVGTEINAHISYRLPGGDLGSVAGKLISPLVEKMIREDLHRFKDHLEESDITSTQYSQGASTGLDSLVD